MKKYTTSTRLNTENPINKPRTPPQLAKKLDNVFVSERFSEMKLSCLNKMDNLPNSPELKQFKTYFKMMKSQTRPTHSEQTELVTYT